MNEKKVMDLLGKKAVAGILAFVLIVSGICFLPSGNREVLASGDVSFITEKYENIADFRSGGAGNYTAPKPSKEGCEDWLFAGWFTDNTCATAYKGAEGAACAKFVPADVLSVKCQVTSKTDAKRESCKMRLVTTVDSLRYSEVGFDIEYKGNKMNVPIKTVLKTIAATDSGIKYPYVPQIFHEKSNYFATVILTNLANIDFDEPFYIQPYWKTLDGTVVYGMRRYARVEDSYLGIVNVPIRLYSDKQVASGTVSVSYDTKTFEYADNYTTTMKDGEAVTTPRLENGKLVSAVEEDGKTDGTVTLSAVNNGTAVTADGMLANLRFKIKDANTLPLTNTFTVNASFKDKTGATVEGVVVPNVVYKTPAITTKHDATDNQFYFGEIESGKPFVLETTMRNMSTSQWPSAGFILNAGGDSWVKFVVRYAEDHYDLVVWRNLGTDNDYYCAEVYNFPTEELRANPFTGPDGTMKLALVYSGGKYAVYVNDTFIFDLDENAEIQNGHSVASILGSEDVRLGLFAERQITFTDWSYMPLLKSETGSFTYDPKTGSYSSVHDITDNQAYIGSVASGQPFVLETTMKGMSTEENPSSGVILNAGENNWVKFVVRNAGGYYDLLVWRNIWGSDLFCARVIQFPDEMKANPFTGADGTLKLALVYSGNTYSVYVNDRKMFDMGQDEVINENGHTIASILGSGDVRLGLFAERQIMFTDWSYKPLLRAEVGNMTYDSETGYYATVHDDTDNQAYIGLVTGGQPFVLETTMKDMSTTDWPSSGVILNAGGDSWVKIVVRYAEDHYDMVVWRNIWDNPLYCARVFDFPTEELKANPFTCTDDTLKLSLVYSGSKYSVYVNGTLVFEVDENEVINENGHTVASILGSGNVRLGLFAERQITFTDYSFSSTQSSDLTYRSLGGDEGEDF